MRKIDYPAKAAHFEELAARAAYRAATATLADDRDAWEERAARYDDQAAAYRQMARRAA